MRRFFGLCLVYCIVYMACKTRQPGDGQTKVLVSIQAAYHKKIYVQKEGFNGEQTVSLDSAVVQTGLDTFTFYLPKGEERLYFVTIEGTNIRLPFVNDTQNPEVYYNYSTFKFNVKNSPASLQLKQFRDVQYALAKQLRTLKAWLDVMNKTQRGNAAIKDSVEKFNSLNRVFFANYRNFGDTVHSPAAFMAVYDAVDFGNDFAGLKNFITGAKTRFKTNTVVQVLAAEVLDYVEAVTKPYNIGDTLHELILPDNIGLDFSTYSLKGKYVLVNIWSTLCTECAKYNEAAKQAKLVLPTQKFEAVSIAIDDQKGQWLNIINRNHYDWTQLIDEKMWQGQAFKKLRFNGIPYNFIIAPDGRLAAKNVGADSIITVLKTLVK